MLKNMWVVLLCAHMYLYYLYAIIFLLQCCAVLWQSQLTQPSGNRLMLHGDRSTTQMQAELTLSETETQFFLKRSREREREREHVFNEQLNI